MKKSFRNIACILLAGVTAFPFAGCNKGSYDPETTPFVMSTDALDGTFNPFFATSAPDVNVAAQTQIGMLSTDKDGNMICGQNEPTVALDYKITMKDENDNVVTDGDLADSTEYEFVIKNGIKFSDGDDLTLEDVLFNLYVYLDPAYTGSATLYSTKIQGLSNYRKQEPAEDGVIVEGDVNKDKFYADADERMQDLIYLLGATDEDEIVDRARAEADLVTTQAMFLKDLATEWAENAGTLESYEKKYSFTEVWEIFYYVKGIVKEDTEVNSNNYEVKKVDPQTGKYITNLDTISEHYSDTELIRTEMATALAGKTGIEKDNAMKETAIARVYEQFKNDVKMLYGMTYDNIYQEFVAQAQDEYFKDLKEKNDGWLVDHISGISYYNTSTKAFTGGKMGSTLDASGHDVLKIVIDNVDPKAIYNFSFTVSPMHYYGNGKAGTKYENYATNNINLYPEEGEQYHFGVSFNDKEYFDSVLKDVDKNGLPVGAGVYKASCNDKNNTPTRHTFYKDNQVFFERNTYFNTVGKGLHNANIKYMEFKVVPSNTLIDALKLEDIHYAQPNATDDNAALIQQNKNLGVVSAKTNGYGYVGVNPKYVSDINVRRIIMRTMDLSAPSRYYGNKSTIVYRSMSASSSYYPEYDAETGELKMNGGTPIGVYKGGVLGSTEESSSLESYKDRAIRENGWTEEQLKTNAVKAQLNSAIKTMIKEDLNEAGWSGRDGETWTHVDGKHKPLKYTFTIAGDTKDHPANDMFTSAAAILNDCGFDIIVRTDPLALTKLSRGDLAVWAAAWSSTIDPDMYQVYHKDSTAASVRNWGYKEILNDTQGLYSNEERAIIDGLSELIEQGRETLDEDVRFGIYCEALDYVMELAVELPTYQRDDMYVYNKNILDSTTLNTNVQGYEGVLDRLWELNFKK